MQFWDVRPGSVRALTVALGFYLTITSPIGLLEDQPDALLVTLRLLAPRLD